VPDDLERHKVTWGVSTAKEPFRKAQKPKKKGRAQKGKEAYERLKKFHYKMWMAGRG
jgi:hypothetical protein